MVDVTDEMVRAAADAIRREIDILLADYQGDLMLIAENESERETPESILMANAKLLVYDHLREMWSERASASEERLEGVAKAALAAAIANPPAPEAPSS